MSRRFSLALGVAVLSLALLVWAAWALVGTTAGLRFLVSALASRLPPDALAVEVSGGSLRDGFQLRHLRWQHADQDLEAEDVDVQLALEPLLGGGLVVESMVATAARLRLHGAAEWPARIPDLWRPPLALELRDLRVDRVELYGAGSVARVLERVQASLVLPVTGPALLDGSLRAAGVDATAFGRWGETDADALDVEFHWQAMEPMTVPARGSGRVWGQGPALRVTHQLVAPLQATLDGSLQLSAQPPQWQAHVELPEGQRLPGPPAVSAIVLPALQFDLKGDSFETWQVAAKAPCALPGLADARCQLQAVGTVDSLAVETFTLTADATRVEAKGRLAWPPAGLRWQFDARARRVDPARLWPGMAGQLDFRMAGEGEGLTGSLRLSQLTGALRGHAVTGEASGRLENGALLAANAALRAGRASLSLASRAAEPGALAWRVEIPALGDLLPAARGRLSGHGDWQGSAALPVTRGVLEGTDLALSSHGASTLSLRWDIDAKTAGEAQALQLSARGVRVFDVPLQAVDAALRGTRERQHLEASLQAAAGKLTLEADGKHAANGSWQGSLRTGRWQPLSGAALVLAQPGVVEVGIRRALTTATCWSGRGAVCLDATVQPGAAWRLQVEGTEFDLSLLGSPLLPGGDQGTPRVTGKFTLSGTGSALDSWQGRLAFELPAAPLPGETSVHLEPLLVDLQTSSDALALVLATSISAPVALPLRLSLATPRHALLPAWTQWPLEGSLRGAIASLAPLAEQTDELAEVDGRAALDLLINGSIDAPVLAGSATLDLAHAHFTRFGAAITDFKLIARGQPSGRLGLEGQFLAGEGKADINGALGVTDGVLAADLAVEGERVRFIDLPEASAVASGRLRLHLEPRRASVQGALTVPEASLKLRDRATATRRSADVLLEQQAMRSVAVPPLDVAVALTLGKSVALEAGGFSGRLTGNLALVATPSAPLRATGELHIEDGRYTRWGETLSLRNSRLLFADQALDDPRVDARAEREVGGVTAGLRVSGRLREPEGRLYSNPSLPDVDILSYLIAGQPLSSASSTDARNLMGAAASMGLRGSGLLSQKVASAFGLDTLQVGTRNTGHGPALDVGKFISPQLYVGYGAGLLERANTFRLRYLLGKRWTIEAETGSRSGADLLYSIER